MSEVYTEKPNVVYATFKDNSGSAERYIVGPTLDTVLAVFDADFRGTKKQARLKAKRHRRTKAELAGARANEPQPKTAEGVLSDKTKRGRKSKNLWPEQEQQEPVAA